MTEKRGYTLIELLIVVALFSTLLSIALPNTRLYTAIRQKQEINEFKKDLLYARNSAIVENKSYSVYFFVDKNSYSIKENGSDRTVKTKAFTNGLRLNKDHIVGSFTFTPRGSTANSNTLYIERLGNKRYKVTLTPATGRVEITLE